MHVPNNLCASLIVYGSYAPGGDNHNIFASLPGEWKKGKIKVGNTPAGTPDKDDIEKGDDYQMEAWMIEFSDCNTETSGPHEKEQKHLLFERWNTLDQAMGTSWGRAMARWWPDSFIPEDEDDDGMLVVNMYFPIKNFPVLTDS